VQDQIFLTVIAVPLLCLVAVVLYTVLRSKPDDKVHNLVVPHATMPQQLPVRAHSPADKSSVRPQSIFEDPQTGAVFQSTDGSTPARDQKVSMVPDHRHGARERTVPTS
jgi:hypothetical protein